MRRALLLGLLAAALYLGWRAATELPLRAPNQPPLALVVPEGASAGSIARQLQELGLVRHAALFHALVLLRGDVARLRAGEYALEGPLSLAQIVDKLTRGEVVRREITFPEGMEGFNTYVVPGLPPGPIATPSVASIDAALDPDTEEGYVYFVAIPDGGGAHAFAGTRHRIRTEIIH